MTDLELLKYMECSWVDLAFKDKKNYYAFLDFLCKSNKIPEHLHNNFSKKLWHHITFYTTDLRNAGCLMHGNEPNRNKKLIYYEDVITQPLVVELL